MVWQEESSHGAARLRFVSWSWFAAGKCHPYGIQLRFLPLHTLQITIAKGQSKDREIDGMSRPQHSSTKFAEFLKPSFVLHYDANTYRVVVYHAIHHKVPLKFVGDKYITLLKETCSFHRPLKIKEITKVLANNWLQRHDHQFPAGAGIVSLGDHSQNTVKAPNQIRKEKNKEVLPEKLTKSNRINCTKYVCDNNTTEKEPERKSTRNEQAIVRKQQ